MDGSARPEVNDGRALAGRLAALEAELTPIARLLHEHQTFLIGTHVSPDPDAIGSAVALQLALRQLGKVADVVCPSPVPAHFAAFSPELAGRLPRPSLERYECGLAVDVSVSSRLPEDFPRRSERLALVDHHDTAGDLPVVAACVRPEVPACCMLIRTLLRVAGVSLTPAIANALYAGIVGDTGHFTHANTDAWALSMAAELVEHGAQPFVIAGTLQKRPLAYYQLLAEVVPTFQVEGPLAYGYCRAATWRKYRELDADLVSGLMTILASIEGPSLFAFVTEQQDGSIRVRLRSPVYNVRLFAERWGGGGHDSAAGIQLRAPGDFETVYRRLVDDLRAYVATAPAGASARSRSPAQAGQDQRPRHP